MQFRFWKAWRERDEARAALQDTYEELEKSNQLLSSEQHLRISAEALASERLNHLERVYTELFQANKSRDEAVKRVMDLAAMVSPGNQPIPDIKSFKQVPRLARRPDPWLGSGFVSAHEKVLHGLEVPAPSAENVKESEVN